MIGRNGSSAIVLGISLYASCGFAQSGDLTADQIQGSEPYVETARRYLQGVNLKIVGGKPVQPGTYKWQASLQISWITDGAAAHFCGGSLVAAGWILTAGHCLEDQKPTDFTVLAGTTDLKRGGQRRSVARILIHKDYDTDTSHLVAGPHPINDVALVKVLTPFNMTSDLQLIPLVDAQEEASIAIPGKPVTLTGFGATMVGGNAVQGLMEVEVQYIDRRGCNAKVSYDGAITEAMVCAGVPEGNQDSCQGDSGGPLEYHPLNDDVKQMGIVSWGEQDQCGRPLKYGVYTRVSSYRDWIVNCIADPDHCPAK